MSYTAKDILHTLVAPALGCTEPVAVALGSAAAASLLPERPIDAIQVAVDPNVLKNGLGVTIPGTSGLKGLDWAAALGALIRRPDLNMELLNGLNQEILSRAKALIESGGVSVKLLENTQGLTIHTTVQSGPDLAESHIEQAHDRITGLRLNADPLEDHPLLQTHISSGTPPRDGLDLWLRDRSLAELVDLSREFDSQDLSFLKQGVAMNLTLAEYGLEHGSGLGIGKTLQELSQQGRLQKDMVLNAKIITAAAADARMAGADLPAMSSAGSGNNGLTAILPIWSVHDALDCSETEILTAIGLSHLITAMIKTHTGKLAAICSCSIAAGAGAAAGIACLLGGGLTAIGAAINNLIADLGGTLCDGAKPGCALKLATASGAAVQAALLGVQGVSISGQEGFQGQTPEKTIRNLGIISRQGMLATDRTILDLMLQKTEQGRNHAG